MSDRSRRTAGSVLIAAAAVMCLIPAATGARREEYRIPSGNLSRRTIAPVATERSGGIRVNDADEEELTALHGIGETIAGLIMSERLENGPFHYAEDLESVRRIGPRTLQKIRGMIDLSTDESGE